MAKKVLFVVEGGKVENDLIIKTFKRVMNLSSTNVEVVKYSTVIYDLYDRLMSKEYDSLIDYIWVNHKNIFKGEYGRPRDYFSSIYLVFDFDPQDHRFSIEKCKWLASYFQDETENGKLYFNYPMVESLIDIDNFNQNTFNTKTISRRYLNGMTYKNKVNNNSLIKLHPRKYSLSNPSFIKILTLLHLRKYRYLVDTKEEYPYIDSLLLLDKELMFYRKGKISIINSAILILCDYNIDIILNLIK